eukprot:3012391-Rhodomonas_salina.1
MGERGGGEGERDSLHGWRGRETTGWEDEVVSGIEKALEGTLLVDPHASTLAGTRLSCKGGRQ